MLVQVRRAVVTLLLVLVPIESLHAYNQALLCPPHSDSAPMAADEAAIDHPIGVSEDHGSGLSTHQQHACCHHFAWAGVCEPASATDARRGVMNTCPAHARLAVHLEQPHRPPIPA